MLYIERVSKRMKRESQFNVLTLVPFIQINDETNEKMIRWFDVRRGAYAQDVYYCN